MDRLEAGDRLPNPLQASPDVLNQGKLLAAEAALRDALGREPSDSLALYELGEVFFENQHYAGASRFWTQVLEQDPKLGEELKLEAKLEAAQQAE